MNEDRNDVDDRVFRAFGIAIDQFKRGVPDYIISDNLEYELRGIDRSIIKEYFRALCIVAERERVK